MRSGRAVFGTVDVWLLHKLKNVNGMEKFEPITDVTNASATGLFDSFAYQYVPIYLKYFKIKESMLPMVVDNSHDFGYTHKSLLGAPVKIATFIADQPASLIGNACFRNMDAKVSRHLCLISKFLELFNSTDNAWNRRISQHHHRQQMQRLE